MPRVPLGRGPFMSGGGFTFVAVATFLLGLAVPTWWARPTAPIAPPRSGEEAHFAQLCSDRIDALSASAAASLPVWVALLLTCLAASTGVVLGWWFGGRQASSGGAGATAIANVSVTTAAAAPLALRAPDDTYEDLDLSVYVPSRTPA